MLRILQLVKNNLLLVIFFLVTVFSLKATVGLLGREDAVKDVQEQLAREEEEHKRLLGEKDKVDSLEFIEKEARDKLGLAKPGEVVVVLPSEDILRRLAPDIEEEDYFPPLKPIWRRWVELFF